MKRPYITRAILKDYLTIKNVDITFKSGINIIIGKNGTGKTNFINYLSDSLEVKPQMINNVSVISFHSYGEEYRKEINKFTLSFVNDEFQVNPVDIFDVKLYKADGLLESSSYSFVISATKINHGVPRNYQVADEPITDIVRKIKDGYSLFPNTIMSAISYEIGSYFVKKKNFTQEADYEFNLDDSLSFLNKNIFRYSNIEKVRIGQNFRIIEDDNEGFHFNNLYLEFLVNGEWLLFNQLSDGTKRLFYIISEITLSKRSIILLEEPELGLHPHQLYTLMEFIKEIGEQFQFIITTHSPMVLNSLNSDELGNIIIAKIDNGATKLEHLSQEQIDKAQVYMENLDLSDYWIHSDLED